MSAQVWQVLLYSLIPVAASGVGGVIAALWPPSRLVRSILQHFAAGVVLAAAALELLPPVRAQSPWIAIIGFAVGIAVMVLLRWFTERMEVQQGEQDSISWGLITAIGVDILVDGLVAGSGFAAQQQLGLLLIAALALEFVFLGLAVAMALGSVARWLVVVTPPALACLVIIGALVGFLILQNASMTVRASVLAFGAVALMYLVTEELLTEAHEAAKTLWGTTVFFIGFLIYLIITELIRYNSHPNKLMGGYYLSSYPSQGAHWR